MRTKRRLGKGLSALIPETATTESDLQQIELEKIHPNPHQPRSKFDPEKLQELAESIRAHGVVQPVIVSPDGEKFILVAGERRYRAAKLAGLRVIPALSRPVDPATMLQIALIENLQREELNPVEEASAYKQLIEQFHYTQEELAQSLGKSRPTIANAVRLLGLPAEVQSALARGEISAGQARPLLRLTEKEAQLKLARRIVQEGLTARAVERITKRWGKKNSQQDGGTGKKEDLFFRQEVQEKLQHHLRTRVRLQERKKNGTIEIMFYGNEDLERLVALILARDEGI